MSASLQLHQSFPHLRRARTTRSIMYDVVIALVPPTIAAVWFFRWSALWVLLVSVISCMITQMVCSALRHKKWIWGDGSEVVTGLLLGLSIPAGTSLWAVALAGIFAIAVVKEAFGGIGHNFLNPAMAARAMLLISFPMTVKGFVRPDAQSSATPLANINGNNLWTMLFGEKNGSIGETCAVLIILGGVYMLLRGIIRLRVPVICLWSFAIVIWVFGGDTLFTGNPTAHLLSGGLMLGAFFMVTDYTTKPTTAVGECIYAAGVGVINALLRLYGPYPEGMCFAILLMNLATPLLEYLTRPRVYGVRSMLIPSDK